MLQRIKSFLKNRTGQWFPLSQTPKGFLSVPRSPGAIRSTEEAMTLSAYYAGIRLYQKELGKLPFPVYKRDANGGRTKDREHPAYRILNVRPNSHMSRVAFFAYVIKDLFGDYGNSYTLIRKDGNGDLFDLLPIPAGSVSKVYLDENNEKKYEVQTSTGKETFDDSEVIHIFNYSDDGLKGRSILDFASLSCGIHHQIQTAGGALWAHAARPSCYFAYPGPITTAKPNKDAKENEKASFEEEYAGPDKAGKIPSIGNGGELKPFPHSTVEDAQIVEAMGLSVADIARWLGVSASDLGDRANSKYNSLAADNTLFYQRSLASILIAFELEANHKIFGEDSDHYAEFQIDSLLRGDPAQQQTIFNGYVQSGIMLRSECREMLNLPPVEGMDVATVPVNQAVITGAADAQPLAPMENNAPAPTSV